jgi:hypothetical protein
MKNQRNQARYLFGLILALTGFVICISLPFHSTVQAGRADNRARDIRRAGETASKPAANGKIAFTSYEKGTPRNNISTVNLDGSDRRDLTFEGNARHPVWSPDGTKIAFTHFNTATANQDSDIFVMDADGNNQKRLTNAQHADAATWSPDGSRIAFHGITMGLLGRNLLYIMDADGTNQRIICSLGNGSWSLAWSPDGSKLAASGTFDSVFLVNVDDGNMTRITEPPGGGPYDTYPAWSPDGSKIAFTRWTDCDFNDCYTPRLWVVSADGSNPQMLNDYFPGYEPAWSPDGAKIVCAADGDLFEINTDGNGITDITNTPGNLESAPSWQALPLVAPPTTNPIDEAQFFVRQQYHDFLNREPDADGLAFWTNEILSCGGDAQCIDAKRINVSAAYFLSIEFQQTGYLVYRIYKTSYGNLPGAPVPVRLSEFWPDAQQIGQGVIVNQTGWETVLENNKQAFAADFVQRSRFTTAYPTSMAPDVFVDALFANAGVVAASTDRAAAISEFGSTTTTANVTARARALRRVAENSALIQKESNRAFVLTEYFGYLRRNPNEAPDTNFDGYSFWLNKLNQFNGDFVQAEMVKAFIDSNEYRRRFGQ